jgi:uncharacterized protein
MVETAIRWFRRRVALPLPENVPRPLDIRPAPSTRLLILQPTPFCNLDCDYCYLPERDNPSRMALGTVRQAAQRLLDDGLAGAQLTVVWHAGEPLVMPVAFYRQAFEIIDEVLGPVSRVTHAMQTNATLIDARWCRLFKQHAVRVGISVDGPAELHDRHRHTRGGKGSHARVLQGLQQLREHGIDCHAIAVVTRHSLAHADAFFDFFLEHGIHDVGCNFDEAEGGHLHSSLAGREAAHAAFLERLLQRSLEHRSQVVVRELAGARQLVAEPLPTYGWRGRQWPDNAQVMPLALISVAWNGDFSTFSPELLGQRSAEFGDFVIGNVAEGGYVAALQSPVMQRLWPAVAAGIEACERDCAYFAYCGGGAPANKWFENADLTSTETLYCRSMVQRPFDAVLGRLEREREMA